MTDKYTFFTLLFSLRDYMWLSNQTNHKNAQNICAYLVHVETLSQKSLKTGIVQFLDILHVLCARDVKSL